MTSADCSGRALSRPEHGNETIGRHGDRAPHGFLCTTALVLALALSACGAGGPETEGGAAAAGGSSSSGRSGGTGGSGPPGGFGGGQRGAAGSAPASVPVEVFLVESRSISAFLESNGTLEAENDVAIVARTNGPIVELSVEEGDLVRRGQTLARIDDEEIRAQVEISRVNLAEAKQAYDRADRLRDLQLVSPEEYEADSSRYQTAMAQLESNQIQLGYTRLRAPFDGLLIERHVQFAQHVSPGTPLFRLSDFDPLLCPIQIPERELSQLKIGQLAYLTVEAWGDRRFEARVLRIRPVVDAVTGTVKVTLEVEAEDVLRPGMFARVFLRTDIHEGALVVPKAALSLGSIGDTVFVARDGTAERREVDLGLTEGDHVEILSGVGAGETVVTVGQDGLSDGTPIQVLAGVTPGNKPGEGVSTPGGPTDRLGQAPPARTAGRPGGMGLDPSNMTEEQLEAMKQKMRARGLSDTEIEQRLERMRQRSAAGH